MKLRRVFVILLLFVAYGSPAPAGVDPGLGLEDAARVLQAIMDAPAERIPEELLERATCLVVVPGLQVGPFGVGRTRGRGYVACRVERSSRWSAPGVLSVEGGRIGFKIGGATTDLIMLVMRDDIADRLLEKKFAVGPEGHAAAGPVGADATVSNEEQQGADILGWARSNGVLSGVVLEGITLHQDVDGNAALYGRRLETRDVITSRITPPPTAHALLAILQRFSPKTRAD